MRQTLDDYIGPSPLTRIDIDDIVRRGRRKRRRHQRVAACATGMSVLGLMALSVAILPGAGNQVAPPHASASASLTPRAGEADRLLAALKAAIAREAPQVSGLEGLRRDVLQCGKDASGAYVYAPAGPGIEPSTYVRAGSFLN